MRRQTGEHTRESGTASVFSLLALIALLAAGSLAIDLGYLYVARTQLQAASDAAALASAAELGDIYVETDPSDQSSYVMSGLDRARVVASATAVAAQNEAAGETVSITDPEVTVGTWDFTTSSLNPTNLFPNAISILGQRATGANGPVSAFFARVLGRDAFDVRVVSTAALTPLGSVPEGAITLPVGISTAWFTNFCDQPIKFYPTGTLEGCAGWHTYGESPANASRLRGILRGLESQSFTPPPLSVGEPVNFTGGTVASAFPDMKDLYETRRFDEPPTNEFDATVVVYDSPDCSNPSGSTTVVGFASVTVTNVQEAPDKIIDAVVKCDIIHEGGGGGGSYGTLGSIPVLVQ